MGGNDSPVSGAPEIVKVGVMTPGGYLADKATGGKVGEILDKGLNWVDDTMSGPGKYKAPPIGRIPQVVAPTAPKAGVKVTDMPTTMQGGQIVGPNGITAAQIDTTGQQQFQGFQTDLLNQLAAQSRGEGPSLAAQQLQAGTDANIAAQMAALSSARGGANPALARQVMGQSADLRQQAAQQSAMARLQEQLQAQGLLGQVAGQARDQSIGLATNQAALDQEANITNYKGQLEMAVQQGVLDQRTAEALFQAKVQESMKNADLGAQFQELIAKYAAMGLSAQQAQQMAALEVEKMKQGSAQAAYDSEVAINSANKQLLGSLVSGTANLAAMGAGAPPGATGGVTTGAGLTGNISQSAAPGQGANYSNMA